MRFSRSPTPQERWNEIFIASPRGFQKLSKSTPTALVNKNDTALCQINVNLVYQQLRLIMSSAWAQFIYVLELRTTYRYSCTVLTFSEQLKRYHAENRAMCKAAINLTTSTVRTAQCLNASCPLLSWCMNETRQCCIHTDPPGLI